jgi:phage terminase small subunit
VTSEIPEELTEIADDKVLPAFHRLNLKQQKFLLHYLRHGNGAEAYRQAYNEMADDHVAAVVGSRLLTNVDVKTVLAAFQDHKDEDLVLVRTTYVNAARTATKPIFGKDEQGQPILVMEQEDHAVRVKAADSLAKLHGLNAAEKKEISGSITVVSTPTDEDL